ncbi:MAG: hypothetical protein HKN67_13445 [Saprospiraceae bacterium]|nr:hypothetical protein [Bacteroidia bacterium]MBT8230081.1 hypothetical protein [Bacteroidia bacterium]NNF22938.1 hypothetical protein [Saprospiraceae bacterium]NNK90581.1 hypothetical protein [Saprospiraceae bacterium]
MKNLMVLMFMFLFSMISYAQEATSVFLSKMEVEWLDKEIVELQNIYELINNAVKEDDAILISRNKTDIIKSVTNLSSNSRIFCNKMDLDLNRDDVSKNRLSDTPSNYYVEKRRKDPRSQELKLNMNHYNKFKSNCDLMAAIKNDLKASSFALQPNHEKTTGNLELISSFIVLAKNNNKIIQNNLTSE